MKRKIKNEWKKLHKAAEEIVKEHGNCIRILDERFYNWDDNWGGLEVEFINSTATISFYDGAELQQFWRIEENGKVSTGGPDPMAADKIDAGLIVNVIKKIEEFRKSHAQSQSALMKSVH